MEPPGKEYITIKVICNESSLGPIFRFFVPKNITMCELRDKIGYRRNKAYEQFPAQLCYRDDANDLIQLEYDEDLDCALNRHPGSLNSVTFLCVILEY
ncbi:hypothetical protein BDC45DRAFT_572227 [Circinella umbellata]|nr:hypothetical protein BDC45DRAFT_572227 [Circinella umbellata]